MTPATAVAALLLQVPAFENVAAIKGGEHHTLVLTQDGKVMGVGSCTYGCLGR